MKKHKCADCKFMHTFFDSSQREIAICVFDQSELNLMFHIPNGGKRNAQEAARFKQMGVKAGVPDIFLPVPRGGFHGLWIELKAPKGKTSAVQDAFLGELDKQGYKTAVCYGWEMAAKVLKEYLGKEKK